MLAEAGAGDGGARNALRGSWGRHVKTLKQGASRRAMLMTLGLGAAALGGLRPALAGAEDLAAASPVAEATANQWPVPAWDLAPASPTDGRAVVVSLSQQALWAYESGQVVRSTYVSTGTAATPTPVGLFWVNNKFPMETMEGVIGGEPYRVVDVPNVMYFNDQGDALHGAYWHSNFGAPMSHGCVNLPLDVAAWMYEWAPMGMAVQVLA